MSLLTFVIINNIYLIITRITALHYYYNLHSKYYVIFVANVFSNKTCYSVVQIVEPQAQWAELGCLLALHASF